VLHLRLPTGQQEKRSHHSPHMLTRQRTSLRLSSLVATFPPICTYKCELTGLFSQMTFLRRNECKRHEAGHSGLKPFVCRLCPPPAAKFARQDLLTRHARRAHGITARDHREKFQLTPEMVAWSESVESGPVQKRPRVTSLRPRSSRDICLE
jgi:hypothetical protein